MQCDECNEDLVGTYFERDGKNICEKDYEVGVLSKKESFSDLHDVSRLSITNHSIIWTNFQSGSHVFLEESTIFAESTSHVCSLQKYRKKCSVCAEYIQGSYYTKEDNFICAKCYKVRQWTLHEMYSRPFAL